MLVLLVKISFWMVSEVFFPSVATIDDFVFAALLKLTSLLFILPVAVIDAADADGQMSEPSTGSMVVNINAMMNTAAILVRKCVFLVVIIRLFPSAGRAGKPRLRACRHRYLFIVII